MVGKYTQLHDAYISVVEALKHGGIFSRATVDIIWVDSEELTEKMLMKFFCQMEFLFQVDLAIVELKE